MGALGCQLRMADAVQRWLRRTWAEQLEMVERDRLRSPAPESQTPPPCADGKMA